MAEKYIDCSPNFDTYTSSTEHKKQLSEVGFTEKNTIKLLKYQVQSREEPSYGRQLLTHKMIHNRDAIDCYQDAALSSLLSPKEKAKLMGHIDTIITFDPKTKQELFQVVVHSTNPEDILYFKVKHLLYYSKKEMMFKMKALAIAPMIMDYNDDMQFLGMKAMFWTSVDDLIQSPDINNIDNSWATRVYHNFSVENLKVLKGTQEIAEILDIMIEDLSNNAEDVYLAHTFDADGRQKMNPAGSIICGDILDLKQNILKNDVFDAVFSLSCIDWNVQFSDMLAAAWDCVKPGGYFVATFRLTNEVGCNDIDKSYQYINYVGREEEELAAYVVLNANNLLQQLNIFNPSKIIAYGYFGKPSATAVTPYTEICFSAFAIQKRMLGDNSAAELNFNLPKDIRSSLESGQQ